jgi:hypothetical protein
MDGEGAEYMHTERAWVMMQMVMQHWECQVIKYLLCVSLWKCLFGLVGDLEKTHSFFFFFFFFY